MKEQEQYQAQIKNEFGSWDIDPKQLENIKITKWKFHELLCFIQSVTPPHNGRYGALVATKLEEACMMAVKGISKPE